VSLMGEEKKPEPEFTTARWCRREKECGKIKYKEGETTSLRGKKRTTKRGKTVL